MIIRMIDGRNESLQWMITEMNDCKKECLKK